MADYGWAALIPALVNAHTHLELSGFAGKIVFPQPGFPQWLELSFAARPPGSQTAGNDLHRTEEALRVGRERLMNSGTVFFGDITNGGAGLPGAAPSSKAAIDAPSAPERIVFLELLGFNVESIVAAMPPRIRMNDLDPGVLPLSSEGRAFAAPWERAALALSRFHTRSIRFRRQSLPNARNGRACGGFLFRFTRPNISKKSSS